MPMYSYRCEECGHDFEELVSMAKRDSVRCPECGGTVRRAWEGPCTFGINFSSGKGGCEMNEVCASGCGCSGSCKCGH